MKHAVQMLLAMVLCLTTTVVWAGDMDAPAAPSSGASAMNTLEDIYNLINEGGTNAPRSDAFHEPSEAPGSTGRTLTEVYNRALTSSRPAKTGQTESYADYDDGYYKKGVSWPSPRFTDNSDGTVTDNLTGLIWLKNADCFGTQAWATALTVCHGLNSGECDLTDGSLEGDWRLPNHMELVSLLDLGYSAPALSDITGTMRYWENPAFSSLQLEYYWSSTTVADSPDYAWVVYLMNGNVVDKDKDFIYRVWPVRGGQ